MELSHSLVFAEPSVHVRTLKKDMRYLLTLGDSLALVASSKAFYVHQLT